MKAINFINVFKRQNRRVFILQDAIRVINKEEKYTSLFLSRLVKNGFIKRIEKGKYYIVGTDIYTIASNIIYPSYISLFSALKYYGATTQNIVQMDVISTIRHKPIEDIEGYRINFIVLKRDMMFGFYRNKETGAFVAYIEKAIIDSLLFKNPSFSYIEESINLLKKLNLIDLTRLKEFASRINSKNVNKVLERTSSMDKIYR